MDFTLAYLIGELTAKASRLPESTYSPADLTGLLRTVRDIIKAIEVLMDKPQCVD